MISKVTITTESSCNIRPDMVLIPVLIFHYDVTTNENFIPYPEVSGINVNIDSFLIDKYPVTNAQYYEFVVNSGYRPADTTQVFKALGIREYSDRDRINIRLYM